MTLSRRDFMAGVSALAAVSVGLRGSTAIAQTGSLTLEGAQLYKSTCVHCVNFCGIEVTKVGDVIRSIAPDAGRRDYYNHGICPKGVAGGFNIHNPYRLKRPLKRTNPVKALDQDPGWVEIGWDEAFDEIAGRMRRIREDNPAKFIWQHGHGKYLIGDKFPKAFAKAYGTPNVVHRTTTCEAARHVADEITWGYHGFLPDLAHTNLFVVFGSNYFEAEQYARWMDHAVTDAKERGMKVVVVEPRLSHAGAKADQWIPVRPGKDVALVMALSRLLIEAGQIDEDFLITYTNAAQLVGADGLILRDATGAPLVWDRNEGLARPYSGGVVPALRFAEGDDSQRPVVDGVALRTGFEVYRDSLADMTPEAAEEITGVPADTIRVLAAQIGQQARIGSTLVVDGFAHRYRPVTIHTWRGMTAKEHGVQTWRSALMLQMLIGSVDAIGGNILGKVNNHPEYMDAAACEYPPSRVDLSGSVYFPNAHHNICQQVAVTLMDPEAYGLPYVPEMQIFYATNRLASTSETATQFASMQRTFNVAIDVHMSETAWMSDIVLPDLAYLEVWQFAPTRSIPGRKHYAIRQPVVNAYDIPYDGYAIIWELAKRLGIRNDYIAELNKQWKTGDYPFEPDRDYSSREAVELLWLNATRGEPFETAIRDGFKGYKVATPDIYGKGIEAKFKGPEQPKMQFYADSMVRTFAKVEQVTRDNALANLDLDAYRIAYSPVPLRDHAFPTPHREAADYPLYLITFKRMYRNQMASSSLNPILNFALGADTQENAIMVNTATGRDLGLRDGAQVRLETRAGSVTGKCQFTQAIRPDTVGVSYHYGHQITAFPDYARKGIAINPVLELHPDRVSGMNSFNDTKCRLMAMEG